MRGEGAEPKERTWSSCWVRQTNFPSSVHLRGAALLLGEALRLPGSAALLWGNSLLCLMADNRYCLRIRGRYETCRYVLIFLLIFSIIVTIQKTKILPIKANQRRGQNEHSRTVRADALFTRFSQHTEQPQCTLSNPAWKNHYDTRHSEKGLCRPGLYSRTSAADSTSTRTHCLPTWYIQHWIFTFGRHSSSGMVKLKLF